MKSYHNTNKATGAVLEKSEAKAKSQEQEVIEFFKTRWRYSSAERVWHHLYAFHGLTPLTSVRRAFSNLVKAGKLVKTDKTVKGMYGKQIHLYELAEPDVIMTDYGMHIKTTGQLDLGIDYGQVK